MDQAEMASQNFGEAQKVAQDAVFDRVESVAEVGADTSTGEN